MPHPPEQPRPVEVVTFPFVLSSRFDSRKASQTPYATIQTIVRERQDVVDFSVFRLIQNWPESMSKAPPSNKRWYVIVLGNIPPGPLVTQVTDAINTGEPVPIPDEVITQLTERRLTETAQRSFTEIHRTFTLARKEAHNKEKMKRKMQDRSRRRNRGK